MPSRGIETGIWDHLDFSDSLSSNAKFLFVYLCTTPLGNQAGLFPLSYRQITHHTGLTAEEIPALMAELEVMDVSYDPTARRVWVKKFFRRQAHSLTFMAAALHSIEALPGEVQEAFMEYNADILTEHKLTPSLHLSRRECVAIRDDFMCGYCGQEILTVDNLEIDFIDPLTQGGRDNYQNMVATCLTCLRQKGTRTPEQSGQPRPTPPAYHASQAFASLKSSGELLHHWREFFNRQDVSPSQPNVSLKLDEVSLPLSGSGSGLVLGSVLDVDSTNKVLPVNLSIEDESKILSPAQPDLQGLPPHQGSGDSSSSVNGQVSKYYQDNFGKLTPQVLEYIRDACAKYSEPWLRLALEESVKYNKKSWTYVWVVLESWKQKGTPSVGRKPRRGSREYYLGGRYGNIVRGREKS